MQSSVQYLILLFLFWFLPASCNKLTLDELGQEAEETIKTALPNAIVEIKGHYILISGNDSKNVKGLDDFLHSFSSIRIFECENDTVNIVLGVSDYEESKNAFDEIEGFGYNIKVNDNHLIIVGTDDIWTALALYELEGALLSDDFVTPDHNLFIPNDLRLKFETEDPQLIAHLIQKGYRFTLQSEFVMTCLGQGKCTIPQGVACDESFFYFILKNKEDTQSVVFKYDMLTLQQTKQSEVINVGHSNDMTFNADIKSLIVAHGLSQGDKLTMINPDDLSVENGIQISVRAGAITYNGNRRQYALSQGGTTLHFADENFNILRSFSRRQMNGYTAQGMGSDDSFVYFPMSGSRRNILLAYDWDGNLASTLNLDLPYESESMFYANCDYYVCYNHNGAVLYRVRPQLSYLFNGRKN